MGENRSLLTALGAIAGLVIAIYVIMQAVAYYQEGAAEFVEMQRQAGEPILLSETLVEEATDADGEGTDSDSSTEITDAVTTTAELTETTAVTDDLATTEVVTETESIAASEAVTATEVATTTADVATTEEVTATEATEAEATEPEAVEAEVVDDAALDEASTDPEVEATDPVTETAVIEEETTAEEEVVASVPLPEDVAPIFTKAGCLGCHVIPDIPGAVGMVGPDLSEIGVIGATRIEGYTTEEYIRESLLDPNAFLAPECPTGPCLPGLMVQNLGDILTAEEIDAVVAYLSTMGVAE